jgi:hypothetical protein
MELMRWKKANLPRGAPSPAGAPPGPPAEGAPNLMRRRPEEAPATSCELQVHRHQ